MIGRETKKNHLLIPFFMLDCLLLFGGVIALWYVLETADLGIPKYRRGFWCRDQDLSLPYISDSERVVSPNVVYLISFLLPCVLITLGECLSTLCLKGSNTKNEETTVQNCGINFYPIFRRIFRFTGVGIFGAFVTWIIADISRLMTGRLAPYFLTVCVPDYSLMDCDLFITEDVCTGAESEVMQSRMSFPSLFSSVSMYSAIYSAAYIHSRLRITRLKLVKPLFCLLLVGLSYSCGLLDIQDYRHHWTDVFAGFLLGVAMAIYLAVFVLNSFSADREEGGGTFIPDLKRFGTITLPRAKTPSWDRCNGITGGGV